MTNTGNFELITFLWRGSSYDNAIAGAVCRECGGFAYVPPARPEGVCEMHAFECSMPKIRLPKSAR